MGASLALSRYNQESCIGSCQTFSHKKTPCAARKPGSLVARAHRPFPHQADFTGRENDLAWRMQLLPRAVDTFRLGPDTQVPADLDATFSSLRKHSCLGVEVVQITPGHRDSSSAVDKSAPQALLTLAIATERAQVVRIELQEREIGDLREAPEDIPQVLRRILVEAEFVKACGCSSSVEDLAWRTFRLPLQGQVDILRMASSLGCRSQTLRGLATEVLSCPAEGSGWQLEDAMRHNLGLRAWTALRIFKALEIGMQDFPPDRRLMTS